MALKIEGPRSTTTNPAGSPKVHLRELERKDSGFTRDTFMRDLKKVARKIGR